MGAKFGIDISRWQKGLSLAQAKEEGAEFVIIKAGGADSGLYRDSQFNHFVTQAEDVGLQFGVYYFGQAFSVQEAKQEANHLLSLLSDVDVRRVFYDVEGKMLNQGRQHLTDIVKAFCDTINANVGYQCGIYMSASPFRTQVYDEQLKDYSHWVASYSKGKPTIANLIDIWQFGGEINHIRTNKIAGMTVDQNYLYVDDYFSRDVILVREQEKKSINVLVEEILAGLWGNGSDRKSNLEESGYDYAKVQRAVNEEVERRQGTISKTIDQLANEVLAGVWGNNPLRRAKLLFAGYDATAVQNRVDEIINQRKIEKKTYTIVKGDTLSSIAKRYDTTVSALAKENNIANVNKIYVGQVITIA